MDDDYGCEAQAAAMAHQARAVQRQIEPILCGKGPAVQGAILADLLAMWVAGHAPALRADALARHLELVRNLIPVNAGMIAEKTGLGAAWTAPQ